MRLVEIISFLGICLSFQLSLKTCNSQSIISFLFSRISDGFRKPLQLYRKKYSSRIFIVRKRNFQLLSLYSVTRSSLLSSKLYKRHFRQPVEHNIVPNYANTVKFQKLLQNSCHFPSSLPQIQSNGSRTSFNTPTFNSAHNQIPYRREGIRQNLPYYSRINSQLQEIPPSFINKLTQVEQDPNASPVSTASSGLYHGFASKPKSLVSPSYFDALDSKYNKLNTLNKVQGGDSSGNLWDGRVYNEGIDNRLQYRKTQFLENYGKDTLHTLSRQLGSKACNQRLIAIRKNVYVEHPRVKGRSQEEVQAILKAGEIHIEGEGYIPSPVTTIEEACFPLSIANIMKLSAMEKPTHIQSIGWPIAMTGRDLIGISQTGSGKTLAFVLPALLHIMAQPPVQHGDGPIALVLSPTRELAVQTLKQVIQFGKPVSISSACIYGGAPRSFQSSLLCMRPQIVIATPGRLIDFLDSETTNLKRVTFLVLDEADRMLNMGFEPQIRKICNMIRSDRQTLFYSATWPKEVQSIAKEFCSHDAVKIIIGKAEMQVNKNIEQIVKVVSPEYLQSKFFEWLHTNINDKDKFLIFCETKKGCDNLCKQMRLRNYFAITIHGDKGQRERYRALTDFKEGRCNILIATNVASRGLDIKDITYVVNYDVPKTIEDYIHRIGRTGRAGQMGKSVTFFPLASYNLETAKLARNIISVMNDAGQTPPTEILNAASALESILS